MFKKITVFLCMFMAVSFMALFSDVGIDAGAETIDGFVISGSTLTGYVGTEEDLVIPSNLGITSISRLAFADSSKIIRSIYIPDGVTSIGSSAFRNCSSLTSVRLPDTLETLDVGAFQGTGLTEVILPASLKENDFVHVPGPFLNTPALTKVTFADGTVRIPKYILHEASSVETVIIPDTVTEIGDYAFADCFSLSSADLPDSLKIIGYEAFRRTSLSEITFPASLTTTKLTTYTTTEYSYSVGPFSRITTLKEVTFSDRMVRIPDYVLYEASNVETVNIPNTVTEIGKNAFTGCAALTSISLPDSLSVIGSGAFWETSLEEVTLPATLTTTGSASNSGPFADISTLKTVTFADGIEIIPENVLYRASSVENVYIPNTVTEIKRAAFSGFSGGVGPDDTDSGISAENVILPESLKIIGDNAFLKSGLKTIVIPNGVESIGSYAFSGCNSLSSISLPESLTKIGVGAFNNTNLSEIILPASLTEASSSFHDAPALISVIFADGTLRIPDNILRGALNLKTVDIPNTVTEIGISAFENTGLTAIELPEGLKSIKRYAFSNTKLSDVILPASLETAEANSSKGPFTNSPLLATVTFADGTVKIPNYMLQGTSSVETVNFPNTVTEIGTYAFSGSGLKTVTTPEKLEIIGSNAFYNCASLTSISLSDSIKTINQQAFWRTNLSDVTLPASLETVSVNSNKGPFADIPALNKVDFAEGATIIPAYVLRGASNVENITFPDTVTEIGTYAFSGTAIESVLLPESLKSVGNYAFSDSAIKTLVLPDGTESIGSYAFRNCGSLTSVTLPDSLKTIDTGAFWETSLSEVILPASLVTTNYTSSKGPFADIPTLKEVTFAEGATTIPANILRGTSSVETVNLPNAAAEIGNYAFQNCTGISALTIPVGVTKIGSYVFSGCTELENLKFQSVKPPSFGSNALNNCAKLEKIYVPKGSKPAYQSVSQLSGYEIIEYSDYEYEVINGSAVITAYNGDGGNIVIPDEIDGYIITGISENAFASLSGITSVTIPDSVASIGGHAFYNCADLTSIIIPDSVTSIGDNAFNGCSDLIITCREGSYAYSYASQYGIDVNIISSVPGDADGDGVINAWDVSELSKFLVGLNDLSVIDAAASDINGDGEITAWDVTELKKHLVGLPSALG